MPVDTGRRFLGGIFRQNSEHRTIALTIDQKGDCFLCEGSRV